MQSGTVSEGILDFRWTLTSQLWSQNPLPQAQSQSSQMELLTAEVKFSAQGKDYSVKSSTLANQPSITGAQ